MNLIVLTCRNNAALSRACLPTLLNQSVTTDVLIVDNASTDGTAAWARSEQSRNPRIHRMNYRDTVSVAQMWNDALKWCWSKGVDMALCVNNDVELMPETFEILSLSVMTIWERPNLHYDPGMATCVSVRERDRMIAPNTVDNRPHPDFSCFCIARWAWEEIGGFDENCIGAFLEDNIAHVEMHRRGIRAINTGLPFLHHGSMTIKNASPQERKRILDNAEHNRQYFFDKYGCYPGTKAYERLFTAEAEQPDSRCPQESEPVQS